MKTNLLDLYIAHFILPRKPITHDVEGSPFKIGQTVLVLNNPNSDKTFDKKFAGKIGTVRHFEYEGGCGQTFPMDPMISVRLSNGKCDEFWKEELRLIP
jgi:CarS bacterial SH3 domain